LEATPLAVRKSSRSKYLVRNLKGIHHIQELSGVNSRARFGLNTSIEKRVVDVQVVTNPAKAGAQVHIGRVEKFIVIATDRLVS
jgi:hypothetical protein